MSQDAGIVIVDTSVFLNVLDVPGFNQEYAAVEEEFRSFVKNGADFELPAATVLETGNHITQLSDGGDRRRFANIFCGQVRRALGAESPWTLTLLPDRQELSVWLNGFPDAAMTDLSLGDFSIVKSWEAACERRPFKRVRIWSLECRLKSHDREP